MKCIGVKDETSAPPRGYQVEVSVDEGEWEREECVYGVKRVAIQEAKRMVEPIGQSRTGVRVVDNRTNETVWDNTRSEVR